MPLFNDDPIVTPDEEPESRRSGGRLLVIGLILAAVAAAGYFGALRLLEDEAPTVTERVDPDPAPVAEAEPEPAPEPTPVATPRRAPEPTEPEPEPPPPPPPPTNVLRVTADVDGASVFLDRRYLGTTPLDMADLDPGTHRVNVAAEGYGGIAQTIDIGDSPVEVVVTFREVRLDEAVQVVHKHRMGSCEGRLVATLQGFRYETSHGDAFSVALSDVEEFDVDYLKHNLHLKVRGGRNYNFTDERENADALFVFHRDIEQARERLAQGGVPASDGR